MAYRFLGEGPCSLNGDPPFPVSSRTWDFRGEKRLVPNRRPINGFLRAKAGDGRSVRRVSPDHHRNRGKGSDIANPDESGRNRNERQEHDRKTRSYEQTTGNPYHLSTAARMVVGVLAMIVVITLTALFISGAIHW
jgi:hypothetical protein